jgi:hypothetical protein
MEYTRCGDYGFDGKRKKKQEPRTKYQIPNGGSFQILRNTNDQHECLFVASQLKQLESDWNLVFGTWNFELPPSG